MKNQITAKSVNYSHFEEDGTGNLFVFITDGVVSLHAYLNETADITDFNTNYLANSNKLHVQEITGDV